MYKITFHLNNVIMRQFRNPGEPWWESNARRARLAGILVRDTYLGLGGSLVSVTVDREEVWDGMEPDTGLFKLVDVVPFDAKVEDDLNAMLEATLHEDDSWLIENPREGL